MKKIKELFIKYKEIIMYLIFGVATTGVNWVVYSLLMKAVLVHAPGSDDVKMTVSNVIAWIAAVIFAFITNKLWVFESKSWVPKVAAIIARLPPSKRPCAMPGSTVVNGYAAGWLSTLPAFICPRSMAKNEVTVGGSLSPNRSALSSGP